MQRLRRNYPFRRGQEDLKGNQLQLMWNTGLQYRSWLHILPNTIINFPWTRSILLMVSPASNYIFSCKYVCNGFLPFCVFEITCMQLCFAIACLWSYTMGLYVITWKYNTVSSRPLSFTMLFEGFQFSIMLSLVLLA